MEVLQEKADEAPEKEIFIQRFVDGGRRSLTYKELLNRSSLVAKHLISEGIVVGDNIAIIGPNSIEWIIGQFAIFSSGAIAVQINKTAESFVETMELLKTLKIKAVLLDPESNREYVQAMEEYFITGKPQRDQPRVLLLQKSALSSLTSLSDITLTVDEASVLLPRIQPESSAMIYTTSGSTGFPKMVEMTHMAVVNASYIAFLGTGGNLSDGTCYNDCLFPWIGGSPIFNALNGNTRVFVDPPISLMERHIVTVWNIIMTEQCSNAIFFPHTVLDLIENQDEIQKLGYQLYGIATGGQLINKSLTKICGKLTEKLFVDYGSTEVGIVSFTELSPEMEIGYVGPLLPGYEVKITGENGGVLDRGSLGEINIRSRWMLKTYRNSSKLNEACFTDGGWFRTGDIGVISMEDKLFVKGKSADVIKRGGVKVVASVVEEAMMKLPEIREAVVLSVPDARLFEEVCACYVMEVFAHEIELDQICKGSLGDNVLGSSPSLFLRFVNFPRLKNGKTDKVFLKRLVMERLKQA
ncbi:medium-chain acyl-CoA ligase ACSF2, mitochondrial-like [Pecten maximus]|uniref:medium-chain acyl-CoA ligase ACSF2, mitochondrial-like n=1 Tax=Pecten maximus TaxID=6579 RepID=UPI0014583FB7|nr:medium-chain acyl-CoA ligase ACSF2, mitochondrial-like [Pecten maximus]